MLSRRKRITFNLILIGLLLVLMEAASYAVVNRVAKTHSEYMALDFSNVVDQLKQHEIESYAKVLYDPVLGWAFHPGTRREGLANSIGGKWTMSIDAQGSRVNPLVTAPHGEISIYGDSYAFADEVDDAHSWQAYLSVLAGTSVDNFAVGAAAPDQGVLRLERDLEAGKRPKVVFLGIHTENIKNILSAYRRFYNPSDGHVIGFKPVLEEGPKGWDWVLPKLERPTDRDSIAIAAAHAAQHDVFYKNNAAMPRDAFPYTLQAAKFITFLVRTEMLHQTIYRRYGGNSRDLWDAALPHGRMTAIVDRFVALGGKYGFTPVALFIPEGPDVKAFIQENKAPPYAGLAREIAQRHAGKLIVSDVLSRAFDANKFNLAPFFAHPSPYGNRVIASTAFAAIRDLPTLSALPADQPGVEPGVTAGLADFASGRCRNTPSADIQVLRGLVAENATVQLDGSELVIDAANNDPILFLPRANPPPERVQIAITPPGPTDLELFVMTDSRGYMPMPYRIALQAGRNEVAIDLTEREPLRLRLDLGSLPGRYRLHAVSYPSGCGT